MQVVLTIAGFDPSNGAGVTADLQVFAAHGLFGVSAITALTVQSTLGVDAVEPVSQRILRQTLNHLAADVSISGVKIGMLAGKDEVLETAMFIRTLREENLDIQVVLDTVLRSSSGAELLDTDGLEAMHAELLPHVTWMTPNRAELAVLSGASVESPDDLRSALNALGQRYQQLNIVVTGGDADGDTATDIWRSSEGSFEMFTAPKVETTSTHGTGCAFSSALLSRLMLGSTPNDAIVEAKNYVVGGLKQAPGVGRGKGPLDLLWPLRR